MQPIYRQDDVVVALVVGAVEVDAHVGLDEIAGIDLVGDQAVAVVAEAEGPVVAAVEGGGGDQGDLGIDQRRRGQPGGRFEVELREPLDRVAHARSFFRVEVGESDHVGVPLGSGLGCWEGSGRR